MVKPNEVSVRVIEMKVLVTNSDDYTAVVEVDLAGLQYPTEDEIDRLMSEAIQELRKATGNRNWRIMQMWQRLDKRRQIEI